jgi:aminoglycoside phosphotransferase (APT) family kinase protein
MNPACPDDGPALAWAARALGTDAVGHRELTGGKTSRMLALTTPTGDQAVLRLMTREPWRTHGPALTARERAALEALTGSDVPAPTSLALDEDGTSTGHPAHLMTLLPGRPMLPNTPGRLRAMAELLAEIHETRPARPFRTYQSWAPPAKWEVPPWTRSPGSWRRAFALLAEGPPEFDPTFLHRDFSHRNLLWQGEEISGVVDWVETSTGPAWLDACHAATALAVTADAALARDFLAACTATTGRRGQRYWAVLDAVAYLPLPGGTPLFGTDGELSRLDDWLVELMRPGVGAVT